jgi:hypothetical protein
MALPSSSMARFTLSPTSSTVRARFARRPPRPAYEREKMQMAESQPVPIDSLNSILVYLDIERRSYEDHKDDRQFDHVFRHATKVREWLSSLDMSKPGLVVVIREPDDTEIDPSGHS